MPDEIEVRLLGGEGNAFAILGKVQEALRRGGVPADEVKAFMEEATSGDYHHLLATVMDTVEVT